MTSAAVYTRISRDPGHLRAGVERQREDCETFCQARGWTVAEVYEDNDVSAYSGKARPAYARMLEDVEAGKVGAVVAWHNDRLHRSPRELESFITLVERTGVALGIVTGGDYDLTTPDGRLSARIVGAVARKESEDKSRRTTRKALDMAEKGERSGQEGFGNRTEAERTMVRDAVAAVLDEGRSLRSITADWNARGVLTSYGKPWSQTAVRRLLTSARIAGLRVHGAKTEEPRYFPATWERIIDRETWEAVSLVLKDPGRVRNGGTNARSHLLSGFLVCAAVLKNGEVCGGSMFARPREDGTKRYLCAGNVAGHQQGVVAAALEEEVRAQVFYRLDTPEVRDAWGEAADTAAPDARRAAVALADAEHRMDRLEEAHYVRGDMTPATYRRLRTQLERDIDGLRELATTAVRHRAMSLPVDLAAAWEEGDLQWRRRLVQMVVAHVEIRPPAVLGRNVFDPNRVTIVWRPEAVYTAGL